MEHRARTAAHLHPKPSNPLWLPASQVVVCGDNRWNPGAAYLTAEQQQPGHHWNAMAGGWN